MLEHFGSYATWCDRAKANASIISASQFRLLAIQRDAIIGFTECCDRDGWHILATGVVEGSRRRKIGTVLIYLAAEEVRRRGGEVLWIGEAPYAFYRVIGGTVVYRFVTMRKTLEADG
jgi:hypothetical protein